MQEFWIWFKTVFGQWQSWLSGSGVGGAFVLIVAIFERLGIWKMSKKWWAIVFLGLFFVVASYRAWHDTYTSMKGRESDLHAKEGEVAAINSQLAVMKASGTDKPIIRRHDPSITESPCSNPIALVHQELFRPDSDRFSGARYGIRLTVPLTVKTLTKRIEAFRIFADRTIAAGYYNDPLSTPPGVGITDTSAIFSSQQLTGDEAHVSIVATMPIKLVCVDEAHLHN